MRLGTAWRILSDDLGRRSFQERRWDWSKAASRIARLGRSSNGDFRAVVARDYLRFLTGNLQPVAGRTRESARAALDWLLRAQDASSDGGVSLGYFPCDTTDDRGWRPSYPETTGYIMQTVCDYAGQYDEESLLDRVVRMARFEIEIQMDSGAVQGGALCPPERRRAAVFNTGMVLQGLSTILLRRADPAIHESARRAAEFLVSDQGDDGHFRTHGPFVASARIKTYNCLCAWALRRFGDLTSERRYADTAERAVEAALREQRPNGWFANNCLDRPEAPLLHTIGYTLQGVLEVGLLAGRDDFVAAARRGTDPLLERMSRHGFLHARFYPDWEPAGFSSCLTGNAQLAVVCYRIYEACGLERYRDAADTLLGLLKSLQILDGPNPGINGALAGSFPIVGDYMPCGYPNWATKYLLDALMLQDRLSHREA